jgi:hypothetical protein
MYRACIRQIFETFVIDQNSTSYRRVRRGACQAKGAGKAWATLYLSACPCTSFDDEMADDRHKDNMSVLDCYQVCAFPLRSVDSRTVGEA